MNKEEKAISKFSIINEKNLKFKCKNKLMNLGLGKAVLVLGEK
jgi:hypothetical protein